MRMVSAAAVVVLLTVPAYAQMSTPNINLMPELTSKSPEEKEADAIKEKAYKDSLRKIPDAKASSDPWGTVRSTAPGCQSEAPRGGSKSNPSIDRLSSITQGANTSPSTRLASAMPNSVASGCCCMNAGFPA